MSILPCIIYNRNIIRMGYPCRLQVEQLMLLALGLAVTQKKGIMIRIVARKDFNQSARKSFSLVKIGQSSIKLLVDMKPILHIPSPSKHHDHQ